MTDPQTPVEQALKEATRLLSERFGCPVSHLRIVHGDSRWLCYRSNFAAGLLPLPTPEARWFPALPVACIQDGTGNHSLLEVTMLDVPDEVTYRREYVMVPVPAQTPAEGA